MRIFKPADQFGQIIPNLTINGKPAPYPVYNDREIRATAGVMFLIGISTFFYTLFTRDFNLLNYIIPLFFIDFLIKVFQGTQYSPFGIVGAWMVKNQTPEYVGAIQKRFAWSLGLIMATSMIIIALLFQVRGILPLTLCSICLLFMWMETSLGICVGCKIYAWLLKAKILPQPQVRPVCPGGVCSIN